MEELRISTNDAIRLISRAVQIGYQKGLADSFAAPKYISQNKAFGKYGRYRVVGWVEAGLLKPKPCGGGRTSTIYYEFSKCEELDLSETIVIRKPYNVK